MFTSDRKKAVEYAYKLFNYACICLTAAIFCALFGAVYEVFSHGVFSFYMIYAFAIPLCLGTFPLMIILLCAGRKTEKLEIIDLKEAETLYEEDRYWENSCLYLFPGRTALNAWFSGIAALTAGCLFQGVLEIYGTTNRLIVVYPVAGVLLLAAGLAAFVLPAITARRTCALKNETLPHALQGGGRYPTSGQFATWAPPALQGEGDGEGVHCSRARASRAFPALYVAGPL